MTDYNSAIPIEVVVDHPADGVAVAAVSGEVDMLTAPALRAAVDSEIAGCRMLVLDLSAVSFLGSAGLAVLVETWQEAKRRQIGLRLVAAGRSVRRPLEITGLDEVLTMFSTLEDAVSAPC